MHKTYLEKKIVGIVVNNSSRWKFAWKCIFMARAIEKASILVSKHLKIIGYTEVEILHYQPVQSRGEGIKNKNKKSNKRIYAKDIFW